MSGQVVVDEEYRRQIEKARRHLRALISDKKCAPLMLRLAWNDAGTYDPSNKIKGGPNGSIRFEEVLKRDINKDLKQAVDLCEEVRRNCPRITYADLFQLAGVVAVEITGGPQIDFSPGRKDSAESESPEEGRLATDSDDASKLRKIITRVGIRDQDFVALYGGLRRLVTKSDQPDGQPLKFDNSYFKELLEKASKLDGADKALVEDENFRKIVDRYAKDEDAFFAHYAAAYKRISELGFDLPASSVPSKHAAIPAILVVGRRRITAEPAPCSSSVPPKPPSWNRARLAQGAIGIAVATTVVILGYFLGRRSK